MMKLDRQLVFFDLETTGVDIVEDRIVQIAIRKMDSLTTEDIYESTWLINPGISIPPGATEVHGITDEMVKDEPTFKEAADYIMGYFVGADLAGYNIDNFDIPLLAEEFGRCGIDFPEAGTRFVDVMKIERLVNSHKLTDAYKRYTGEDLEGAHDAGTDNMAAHTVLVSQLLSHDLPGSVQDLHDLGGKDRVDLAGKLYRDEDGIVRWAFGKHKDSQFLKHLDYADWVLKQKFPRNTKQVIMNLMKGNH